MLHLRQDGARGLIFPQQPAPRAPLKALEDVPRRVAAMCITDADGLTKVPPRRSGQRLGDFIASAPARRCKSNRFRPFFPGGLAGCCSERRRRARDLFLRGARILPLFAFPVLSLPTTSSPSGQGEKVVHVPILASTAMSAQPANCVAASIAVINRPGHFLGPDYGDHLAGALSGQDYGGEFYPKESIAGVGYGGQVYIHARKESIVRVGHGGNTNKHARIEFDKHDMSIKQPAQASAKQPAQAPATAIVGHGGISGGKGVPAESRRVGMGMSKWERFDRVDGTDSSEE